MSEIQAKCPHCSTAFSISTEQLKVANGHVRCGVCMKVFNASENNTGLATKSPDAPTTSNATNTAFEDESSIEAWIKKNQKPAAKSNIQSGPVSAPENNIAIEALRFDDEISDAFINLKPAAAPGTKEFALIPQEELNEKPREAKAKAKVVPAYAAELADNERQDDQLTNFIGVGSPVKAHQITDIQPVDELKIDDSFDDDPFNFLGNEETVVHASLGSVEIEEEKSYDSRFNTKVLWSGLTALFSVLLIVQILINEFDQLAMNPNYRGIYSPFCAMGICHLPAFKDVAQVRGSNLIVRPHPRQKGALLVDAIVNNQAPFEQPFPDLSLRFSNIQGTVIASRTFKPEEYLTGELKGLTVMPAQTPLHLSLEIVDPGPDAISYHLDFLPNS